MNNKLFYRSLFYMFIIVIISSCSKDEKLDKKSETNGKSATLKAAYSNAGCYTWYSVRPEHVTGCTKVQVDIRLAQLGNIDGVLFFPAMQVNFNQLMPNGEGDGGHMGFQKDDQGKTVNWGGYFVEYSNPSYRYTPFFNSGPAVPDENQITPDQTYNPDPGVYVKVGHFDPGTYTQCNTRYNFNWQMNKDYRYEVERGTLKNGYYRWNAYVVDIATGARNFINTLYSKGSYITGFLVWVETSIPDGNIKFDVRWKYPKYWVGSTSYVVDINSIGADVSNNPNNSVVVPSYNEWVNKQITWHRNGLAVPSTAYKYKTYNSSNW